MRRSETRSELALGSTCSCKTATQPPMGTSCGAAGRWTARGTSRDQPTLEWTTAVVCSTSLERKQECRTLSGWLLASTQSQYSGASGIRQPRTTGSSRSCMTRWQKSPSSTPARSVSASSLSGADDPKVLAARKRVTRPRPRQSQVVAVQPNAQQQQQAEAQRKAAQTVFSVHTRSELEALKLCHHLTL